LKLNVNILHVNVYTCFWLPSFKSCSWITCNLFKKCSS